MNISLQIGANLSILSEPFLPFTAQKLSHIFSMKEFTWDQAGSIDLLKEDIKLGESGLLFEKIEDEAIEKQKQKLLNTKTVNEQSQEPEKKAVKEEVNFDDFMKMDIRVGEIKSAESVPKSNKLLKFQVDIGGEERTILSGVAKYFSPEEMIGKKVTVLLNLAPRKIMGVESQGMLLFAENGDGQLKAVSPSPDAENGATIS